MVIIPYNTDAPLYHYPIITGALVATNIGLFIGVEFGELGHTDDWLLRFGQGMHPVQWLSCNFMHLGPMHLIGNMMFLWVFGLITEGKLGWWRFLICYLGIGIASAAIEQFLLSNYRGPIIGSAGALSAIFGLMGMALIWAPKNEVECYFAYWMHIIRTGSFDVSVTMLTGIFFGLNILFLLAHGQLASSEAAHLLGGACGLAVAVVLLKTGRVDCEGWDAFSIWRGDTRESVTEQAAAEFDQRKAEVRDHKLEQAPRLIAYFLEQNNPAKAWETYIQTRDLIGPVTLDTRTQQAFVKHLLREHEYNEAIVLLVDLVKRSPHGAHRARLKLAELLLTHHCRPLKALKILSPLQHPYPRELESLRLRLIDKAERLRSEGVLELRD